MLPEQSRWPGVFKQLGLRSESLKGLIACTMELQPRPKQKNICLSKTNGKKLHHAIMLHEIKHRQIAAMHFLRSAKSSTAAFVSK